MPAIVNFFHVGRTATICTCLVFLLGRSDAAADPGPSFYVDPKDTAEWRLLRDSIRQKKEGLEQELRERWNSPSIEQIPEYNELQQRITRLNAVLKNLENLKKSKQHYVLKNLEGEPGQVSEGGTVYSVVDNVPTIEFRIGRMNVGSFIHETTHGGQFEKKELVFDKTNGIAIGDDLDDEIEAYKAEYAYNTAELDPLISVSVPRCFDDITASWILGLQTKKGEYLFSLTKEDTAGTKIGLLPVNLNIDLKKLRRAFPCCDVGNSDRPLKNAEAYYYKQ
ncbi:MAG TPA: hypothetical protein VKQ52_04760 [Puia sp.]|nr:hypothetical protein [Puia sp.]